MIYPNIPHTNIPDIRGTVPIMPDNAGSGENVASTGESFAGDWLLADKDTGQTILPFTSFIEAALKRGGSVTYEPIEKGSFASYNKTSDPFNAIVTVAVSGTKADIQSALDTFDELQKNTVLFSFVSPVKEFENLTLESFSWKWEQAQGADVLYAELALIEVREVETLYTDTEVKSSASISAADAKNPSDASTQDRGMVSTEAPTEEEKKIVKTTAARDLRDAIGL